MNVLPSTEGGSVLLAVDVGNSTTVLGVFDGDRLAHHWRLSTRSVGTSDEQALAIAGMLGFAGLQLDRDVTGVVVGSVVPSVTEVLRRTVAEYVDAELVVVEPGVRTGIPIRHDHPRDLGADRIANAVAVQSLYPRPAIAVDFGTAISFDVVDATGAFVGGAIAPGVGTSAKALVVSAPRLPTIELSAPASPVGRSTVTALQSGVVHGFAGLVDGLVTRLSSELDGNVTVVATGGAAGDVLEHCLLVDHRDPWLTLKGLRLIWERNHTG